MRSENRVAPVVSISTGAKEQNHPCDVAKRGSIARVLSTVIP